MSAAAHFSGHYENRISAKGQVSVPGRLRQLISEEARARGFVLLPGRENCLYLYPDAAFAEVMERVAALAENMDADGGEFYRSFSESAVPVEMDSQGRLVIPEALRRRAGLTGGTVVFVGLGRRIEVWSPEARAAARMAEDTFTRRRADHGKAIFGL